MRWNRCFKHTHAEMIIVGTGDHTLEKKLVKIGQRYSNLSVNILFSNRAAHLLEAGSDFFLMPSRYEPCGLNQLYSLRYGTLPVARRTGGLADSILDLDENPETGTGILFDSMTGRGILEAVERALHGGTKERKPCKLSGFDVCIGTVPGNGLPDCIVQYMNPA